MSTLIKDSIRQFIIAFLALGVVLLIATLVHAQTATYPNGNVVWPVNCGPGGTNGNVITTDANGNLTCSWATYQ